MLIFGVKMINLKTPKLDARTIRWLADILGCNEDINNLRADPDQQLKHLFQVATYRNYTEVIWENLLSSANYQLIGLQNLEWIDRNNPRQLLWAYIEFHKHLVHINIGAPTPVQDFNPPAQFQPHSQIQINPEHMVSYYDQPEDEDILIENTENTESEVSPKDTLSNSTPGHIPLFRLSTPSKINSLGLFQNNVWLQIPTDIWASTLLLVDRSPWNLSQKESLALNMKNDWQRLNNRENTKLFNFLNKGSLSTLQWAWAYLDRYQFTIKNLQPSSESEYREFIRLSIDTLTGNINYSTDFNFLTAQKTILVGLFKNSWNQQKFKEDNKDYTRYYTPMTKKCRDKLTSISKRNNERMQYTLERLIEEEYKRHKN